MPKTRPDSSLPPPPSVRVLSPDEYPPEITGGQGDRRLYRPEIRFAASHPLGLYYVEHQGAGHLAAYFLPKRKGSRPKAIGGASSMAGALRRISAHEDEIVNPTAAREWGQHGPVSIERLGARTREAKTVTDLDREIEAYLRRTAE